MEKRLIIAMALSILVFLAFQKLAPQKRPAIQPAIATIETKERTVLTENALTGSGKTDISQNELTDNIIPRDETITEIQTEKYQLVFSDNGGSLKEIALNEFGKEEKEIVFGEETPGSRLFDLESGFLAGLDRRKYKMTRKTDQLEYKFTEQGWIEITKRYTFYNMLDYIDLEVQIKNLSPREIYFPYKLVGPSELNQSGQVAGRSFLQADVLIDGKIWKTRSVKGTQERAGDITWVAMKNRYFTLAMKPETSPKAVMIKPKENKNLQTILISPDLKLAPGATHVDRYALYAGPLNEQRLREMGFEMEKIVDYGFFGGVSKVLLSILRFFHEWTKNWGLAIICLTLVINILLFPLTMKSFSSMNQMKKIQPHIQQLKALHKDNPQKLNKETMELYKKYNVNPLGGCLPMLLQMPIFIALYQGLMRSVELKGAGFLWIKDLAKPDAVPIPFTLPLVGDHLNILPLLMVGVMVLQQKLSQGLTGGAMTDEQASQQKMMMLFMPLIFGFLFYRMPSGLVLYWLTNTILMTAEQKLISKRMQ